MRIFYKYYLGPKSVKGSILFCIKVLLIEAKAGPLGKGQQRGLKGIIAHKKGANKRTQ